MEIKENLESFGSLANPNSEKRKIEISDYDASSSDNRPSKRATRNILSGDDDEEEVKSTRSSSSTSSDKTEKIDERINLDLNMPASTDEEDDDRMFLESAWSNNVKQRDSGDGEGEVEEIKLDLNSTPVPSGEGEGYKLEGEVWPEDWDQQVGGCDDDHDDFDGNEQDYYDDGGYDDDDEDDLGNKRIKLDLNSTPLSEEEGEEQEVKQEEKEEDQRQYLLDEEEERPVEVRYQSEEEEEVRLEEEQVSYQEEEENQREVRPEEGQAQYQEDDEEEEDQYWHQSEGEDQKCYQAEEKEVRSEESWHPSEEEVVRLPNTARSNLDFSRTPTKGEQEDIKNSTIPPAKKRDDEPEPSSDSNHSSFVCKICVQHKVSSEWFAIENCGHAYCKDCMIKHVATKLRLNIVSIPCPTSDCVSGSLSPQHCRPILPPDLFDSWASAL